MDFENSLQLSINPGSSPGIAKHFAARPSRQRGDSQRARKYSTRRTSYADDGLIVSDGRRVLYFEINFLFEPYTSTSTRAFFGAAFVLVNPWMLTYSQLL